jgi:hypothetical protein
MTKMVENDGKWNMYREIVELSIDLEEDIVVLRDLLASASEHYEEMYERYCDLPGWAFLHVQLSFALGNPEILGGVLPGEAEKPE